MHCIIAIMMGGSLSLFMCLALFIASLGPSSLPSSYFSTSTSTATINPHVAWLCGILVVVIIGLITLLLFHMQQACFRPSVSDLARRYEEIALREYVARSGHKPSKTKRAKIKGQAQATGTVESSSVNGASTATIGSLTAGGGVGDKATLVGLSGLYLDGDAAGSILGTASGTFNASANSVLGNAIAWANESLTGINSVKITLDGAGTINAIVSDTSFVDAHSVGGTATATSSIDAVALNVATITVGADLMLSGNATVTSQTNAHSV
jgi:hypothetical protein